jgi:serine/threonine-protein kinase RsbW
MQMTQPNRPAADTNRVRTVEVLVDAVAGQIPLLRSVAADVAIRNDFDLDAIEDLRMAVDEAAALLVGCAVEDARLHCELRPEKQRVLVRLAVDAKHSAELSRNSMGWQILSALTSEVRADVQQTERGDRMTIELARVRSEKISA